jgi:hypothetical protein
MRKVSIAISLGANDQFPSGRSSAIKSGGLFSHL